MKAFGIAIDGPDPEAGTGAGPHRMALADVGAIATFVLEHAAGRSSG